MAQELSTVQFSSREQVRSRRERAQSSPDPQWNEIETVKATRIPVHLTEKPDPPAPAWAVPILRNRQHFQSCVFKIECPPQ
eukprot:11084268-Karenia_brevis.AAC.1